MGQENEQNEYWRIIKGNVSLLLFLIPFYLHLMDIKVTFSPTDYETYIWILFVLYVTVTYGYVSDHFEHLFSFALLYTVQIHSALFFFKQTIFPLTTLQKFVMTIYLLSICLFMNIMIREYRLKRKKSKVVQKKLLFFVNQCSGTVFAQFLFLELGVFDFNNYGIILNQYPWDLATYILFNLLSVFGFFVGIYQMFSKMKTFSKSSYNLQRYWLYFTSLFACLCLLILKYVTGSIPELYIIQCTYFYFFILFLGWQSKSWFLILCIFLGVAEIVIQVKFHADFNDVWVHICVSINNIFLTRSLAWLFIKVYTYFHGEMDEKQKEVVGFFFEM